jgi:hypothetical protein
MTGRIGGRAPGTGGRGERRPGRRDAREGRVGRKALLAPPPAGSPLLAWSAASGGLASEPILFDEAYRFASYDSRQFPRVGAPYCARSILHGRELGSEFASDSRPRF